MNPIEKKFLDYEAQKKGAVIVEVPLLSPIPNTQIKTTELLIKAGIDIVQIPLPVRFPWMYGKRILMIQKAAAENDVCYKQSFEVLSALIGKYPGTEFMPVGFYGGLQRMGQENYIRKCRELGIRIVDVPDYPLIHDDDPKGFVRELRKNHIDYVTIIDSGMAMQPEGTQGYDQLTRLVGMSHGFCFLLAADGGKNRRKR